MTDVFTTSLVKPCAVNKKTLWATGLKPNVEIKELLLFSENLIGYSLSQFLPMKEDTKPDGANQSIFLS